eukprot:1474419-Amphidinium_carterae.1
MLQAERAAWREVVIMLHGGKTLAQALDMMEKDALFWQQHVYSKDNLTVTPTLSQGWSGKGGKWSNGKGGKSKAGKGAQK